MPEWLQSGVWGLLAGAALVVGAAIGYSVRLPQRVIAGVMSFGTGVLISALSFELMEEAFRQASLLPVAAGFFAGAVVYSAANFMLGRSGAKNRKRSSGQSSADEGGGTAIAVGSLLDGIPEAIAIGLTMLAGGGVSVATIVAISISNLPEGLSSTAGMKSAGRSAGYIFGVWITIAVLSGLAALAGYTLFGRASVQFQAATTAVAAGAILAMLVETMIPEAFEGTREWSGLISCAGFTVAFALSMLWG
jgi:ZIP family zinc transporter